MVRFGHPFAKVTRASSKPSIAAKILDAAKVTAAEVLRDGSAKIAADLIAAAQRQETTAP